MMQRGPVAGKNLRGSDPNIMIQGIGDGRVLVVNHARCRDLLGWDIDNDVGGTKSPFWPVVYKIGEWIGTFTSWCACFDQCTSVFFSSTESERSLLNCP